MEKPNWVKNFSDLRDSSLAVIHQMSSEELSEVCQLLAEIVNAIEKEAARADVSKFKQHSLSCPAYGNYQPPYEECTCGADAAMTDANSRQGHVFIGEECVNCGIPSMGAGGYVIGGICPGKRH